MKKLGFLIKLIISGTLLILVAKRINIGDATALVATADVSKMLWAPLYIFVGLIFAALRWGVILRHYCLQLSFSERYKFYLIAYFFNSCLPGGLGGDVVRVGYACARLKEKYVTQATIVLFERFFGLCGVLVFGCLGLLTSRQVMADMLPHNMIRLVWILAGAFLGGLLLLKPLLRVCNWVIERAGVLKKVGALAKVTSGFNNKDLVMILWLSLLYQFCEMLAGYTLLTSLHLSVPLSCFFAIYALVSIVIIIPISLGGLGVREGVLVYLLAGFGVSESTAVLFAFSLYLNKITVGLLGGGTTYWLMKSNDIARKRVMVK